MTGPDIAVARTFIELTDLLVAEFDLAEFLQLVTTRTQQAVGVEAVGLLLADNHGGLNVVAASNEQARVLELFQLQNAEGPCLECYETGRTVSCPELRAEAGRWPRFVPLALDAGFAAVHALPMRLRDQIIGGMNLFTTAVGGLGQDSLTVAQALTDVATIALLQERASRQPDLLTEQLQAALNNRLAIEQAKGIVAERAGIGIDDAFTVLQRFARSHEWKLADLAAAVVRGDPAVAEVGRIAGD